MAFTYDISTDLGKLRLAVGDTVSGSGPRPASGNYSDAELNVYLAAITAAGYSYGKAVPQVFRLLAGEWAKQANISIGEYSAQYGAVAQAYRDQAAEWDAMLTATGTVAAGGIVMGTVTLSNQVYTVQSDGSVI